MDFKNTQILNIQKSREKREACEIFQILHHNNTAMNKKTDTQFISNTYKEFINDYNIYNYNK